MIWLFSTAALFVLMVLTGKWLKLRREALDRAELDAELRRVWAYKAAGLKEVPEVKR